MRNAWRRGHLGKPRVVEQAGELPQGQPPAARSRLEAAQRAARAEGTAGDGAPPQRPRHRGMETVPERMKQWEGECQSSLYQSLPGFQMQSNNRQKTCQSIQKGAKSGC